MVLGHGHRRVSQSSGLSSSKDRTGLLDSEGRGCDRRQTTDYTGAIEGSADESRPDGSIGDDETGANKQSGGPL